jgi:hypothetical protein
MQDFETLSALLKLSLSVHNLILYHHDQSWNVTLRFLNLLWDIDNKSNMCQTYVLTIVLISKTEF